MNGRGSEARARQRIGAFRPILQFHPWVMPAIVLLGVAASLAEGVGISLFIPLFQDPTASGSAGGQAGWLEWLRGLFHDVPTHERVRVLGLCILGAVVLRALLVYANAMVLAWLDARVSHRLRVGLFDQYLTVGYRYMERSHFGDLLNTLATETWRTSEALAVLVGLITASCTVAVHLTLLLLISPGLTGMVAAALLLISLFVRVLTRRVEGLGALFTRANATLTERMVENLILMPVIRVFNREATELARADAASRQVSDVGMQLALRSALVQPVYEILSGALLVGIVIVALDNPGNFGWLVVFLFVLYRLQPAVTAVDGARTGLRSLLAAVDDVTGMLDRTDKPYLASGTRRHELLTEAIVFDDVTYRYADDERPALDRVRIRIPAGRVTALVGPSGSGKSTLIKLLVRLYDPTSGTVRIDGTALPELDLRSWRGHLAVVNQDVQLFNDTAGANIAYGAPAATQDEIRRAAEKSDAHGFISALPQGYDTELGDDGTRLSGGQQQRVTLARAVIRDPQVLVLDEATNALDNRSELIIQDALDRLSDDRTVVVVAHRFSTITRADHIVVLDEGRVVQQGDRETLLACDGLFRELHDLQRGASR